MFRLEVSGVALVCLCYLDAGSPAHMRYAVRRLRRKLPAATVLLGCLTGVAGSTAEQLREAAKADLMATNLRDVVRQCLDVARGPISDHDTNRGRPALPNSLLGAASAGENHSFGPAVPAGRVFSRRRFAATWAAAWSAVCGAPDEYLSSNIIHDPQTVWSLGHVKGLEKGLRSDLRAVEIGKILCDSGKSCTRTVARPYSEELNCELHGSWS